MSLDFTVANYIQQHNSVMNSLDQEEVDFAINLIIKTWKSNHQIVTCGNGGSASDAQHLAAELSGRFYIDRPPLYAEALHVNSSFVPQY